MRRRGSATEGEDGGYDASAAGVEPHVPPALQALRRRIEPLLQRVVGVLALGPIGSVCHGDVPVPLIIAVRHDPAPVYAAKTARSAEVEVDLNAGRRDKNCGGASARRLELRVVLPVETRLLYPSYRDAYSGW